MSDENEGQAGQSEEGGRASLLDRFPALARIGEVWRKRVPDIRQQHPLECGAACLAMVLGYHGREVRLDEIRDAMGVGRDGVSALNILKTGRYYGLRGRGVQVESIDDLPLLPLPAVLHWEFNHFVVLERLGKYGAELVDPAVGRRTVEWEQFEKAFTGVALTFEPTDAFQPAKIGRINLGSYVMRAVMRTGILARVLVTSLLLQGLALATPMLTGILVDRVVPRDDYHLLLVVAGGMGAMALFFFLTTLVRSYLLLHLRTLLDSQMTFGFLEHLVDLPYAFFQGRGSGDLLNRIQANTHIREILTSTAASTVIDGTLVTVYLGLLGWTSWQLAVTTLLLGGIQIVLFLRARRAQRDLITRTLDAQVKSSSQLVELLAGIETLKASGTEHRALDRWADHYVDELNTHLEKGRLSAWLDSVQGTVRMASPLVILVVGALRVLAGKMGLGEMLALSALANAFLVPLGALVGSLSQFQLLGTYLDRINDVLETPREQADKQVQRPPRLRGNIAIDGVSFRHGPLAPMVVSDVSLQITAGRFVALVGASGSGKSTLARLLVGLYNPTYGRILYDGTELTTLDARAVRAQLGIVTQHSYLFATSIRKNIALGAPNLPLERVIEAAKLACIHDDIVAMPMGYETLLADGGLSLSGGQRQRIALARALVSRPAILLLDEATAALDTIIEGKVQDNLNSLGCTRIIIAHRLSTVVRADQIIVLDQGRIVETGRHDELLARGGRYAELVAGQARKRELPGGEALEELAVLDDLASSEGLS